MVSLGGTIVQTVSDNQLRVVTPDISVSGKEMSGIATRDWLSLGFYLSYRLKIPTEASLVPNQLIPGSL